MLVVKVEVVILFKGKLEGMARMEVLQFPQLPKFQYKIMVLLQAAEAEEAVVSSAMILNATMILEAAEAEALEAYLDQEEVPAVVAAQEEMQVKATIMEVQAEESAEVQKSQSGLAPESEEEILESQAQLEMATPKEVQQEYQ